MEDSSQIFALLPRRGRDHVIDAMNGRAARFVPAQRDAASFVA